MTQSHRFWTGTKGSNVSSPVLHDGHLYWMHESLGIAYCAEASTGQIMYEERIGRAGQVYASPVLADGKLYYLSRNGGVFVISAKPSFEQLAHNQLEDRSIFDASPAVAGNRLLLRSDRFLYCIGKNEPKPWHPMEEKVPGTVDSSDGFMIDPLIVRFVIILCGDRAPHHLRRVP